MPLVIIVPSQFHAPVTAAINVFGVIVNGVMVIGRIKSPDCQPAGILPGHRQPDWPQVGIAIGIIIKGVRRIKITPRLGHGISEQRR